MASFSKYIEKLSIFNQKFSMNVLELTFTLRKFFISDNYIIKLTLLNDKLITK